MDNYKFTKGKWSVDKSGYRTTNGGLCVMNDNQCIAVVGDGNPHQPIDANALLISKAPEMLDMLQILRNDYGNYTQNILQDSHRVNRIKEIEELIKEATEL